MTGALGSRIARKGSPDYILLFAVAVLLIVGVDMVYSASFVIAHNNPEYGSDTYFLVRQLIWVAIGLVAMLVFARVDYHRWRRLSVPVMLIILVLLVAVLLTRLGHSAYGAQRWLSLGPLPPIQPSEFAKMALLLYLADWLSRRGERLKDLSYGTIPFAAMLGTVAGLVLLQPDLGSAFVIALSGVCLFFLAGADIRHFFAGMILGVGALVLAITSIGYRSDRIAAFLDPQQDPLGLGWHIIQSQIALGSGGIFGLGLGASRQKFYYLPGAHTDAIFAVIGEELGLMGTLFVLGLIALLAYRGFRITLSAPDLFGSLLAAGITFWIVFQALINIAVVTATLPFTGIPLPFVSSGGSSMVVSLGAIGLLLNVSKHRVVFRHEKNLHKGAERASRSAILGRL